MAGTSPKLRRLAPAVVPVLIGLVSLGAALVSWRASTLGDRAGDDQQAAAVQDLVSERDQGEVTAQVASEAHAFSTYRADKIGAEILERRAARLGPTDAARVALVDDAEELRLEAQALVASGAVPADFVTGTDGPARSLRFDEHGRAASLTGTVDQQVEALQRAPADLRTEARRLDRSSQRLTTVVFALAGVAVVLTVAQHRSGRLRWALAGVGTAGAVVLFSIAAVTT